MPNRIVVTSSIVGRTVMITRDEVADDVGCGCAKGVPGGGPGMADSIKRLSLAPEPPVNAGI
jgi:hypothetical protein